MGGRLLDSPWQTFRRVADYHGRSTRSELLYFGLLVILVGYAISFLVSGTRYAGDEAVRSLFLVLFLVPGLALLVRRLHDQGRSATWVSAGLPALAAILFQRWQRHVGLSETLFDDRWTALELAGGLSALALLLLALVPPDEGANAYGADPRLNHAGQAG